MIVFDFSFITHVIDQVLQNFEEEASADNRPSVEELAEFFKLLGQLIQIILVKFVDLYMIFDLFPLLVPAVSIIRAASF